MSNSVTNAPCAGTMSSPGTKAPRAVTLRARERKTQFVEIFRTTPANTICPNFYVLAHGNGCTFSPQCAYCYLKSSFWYQKDQIAFTNTDEMAAQIRSWIARDDLESYVLNMGNLSDSLAFETVRPWVSDAVELFREAEARNRKHTLLLVTKGGRRECAPLSAIPPCRNVVISFSVNSRAAARKYETGAASIVERLRAARELKAAGWRVRIRVDPMIAGFDYSWVVEQVRRLAPERVTLGSLRAEKNLERFVGKGLFAGLTEKGEGRSRMARYPFAKRVELYRVAVDALRGLCPIGLCEETPEAWAALGLDAAARSCNCGG